MSITVRDHLVGGIDRVTNGFRLDNPVSHGNKRSTIIGIQMTFYQGVLKDCPLRVINGPKESRMASY